ncbi:MAG TPA: hypothetical protein VGL33_31230, partial [Streptosporangiaceae bacterium]
MTAGAQISQICAHTGGILTRQPAAPNGSVCVSHSKRSRRSVTAKPECELRYRRLFAAARFIGRVDSGTQIIVFGAAGTARPARQPRHHRP